MNVVLALSVFFSLALLTHQRPMKDIRGAKNGEEIDYVVFRQSWPATSCMFPGEHKCVINKDVHSWVIHGLWPSSIHDKQGPTACRKDLKFNFSLISQLEESLDQNWPNLYAETEKDSFWKHEWDKHGTCAIGLDGIQNEKDYFSFTLDLMTKLDFLPILEKAAILPADTETYDLNKVVGAVSDALKVTPKLECFYDRNSNEQYISQMQVCLSTDFKLIECPNNELHRESSEELDENDAEDFYHSKEIFDNSSEVDVRKGSGVSEQPCRSGVPINYPTIKN